MFARYLSLLFVTSLLALAPGHHHHSSHRGGGLRAPLDPAEIYSRRALRRARNILQLKLMELRLERLDRVRDAIRRRMPIDRFLDQEVPASTPAPKV